MYLQNWKNISLALQNKIWKNCSVCAGTCEYIFSQIYLSKLANIFKLPNIFALYGWVAEQCRRWNLRKPVWLQNFGADDRLSNSTLQLETTLQRPSVDARWTRRESFLNRSDRIFFWFYVNGFSMDIVKKVSNGQQWRHFVPFQSKTVSEKRAAENNHSNAY